jgi:hypothetical protein
MRLGQRHRIPNVIAMAMRTKHKVNLVKTMVLGWALRIIDDPRIEQNDFALGGINAEGGVSKPSDPDAVEWERHEDILSSSISTQTAAEVFQ